MPRRALIIGLGLIGGSAGIALRARGWRVGYDDPNVALDAARAAGAADEGQIADPDVVLIATPVDVALETVGNWQLAVGASESGLLTTDNRQPTTVFQPPTLTSACSVMRSLRAVAG